MKRFLVCVVGICISVQLFSQELDQIKKLELYVLNGQYDSSIVLAQDMLQKDTANWLAYYYLGKSYQSKYKYFTAIENFEKANSLDSANAIIENALADSYDFIGKDEKAINIYYDQYLRDTLRLEPIVKLANIFRRKREFGSSIHYYQKANAIDPSNFYYYKQLAYCYDKINIPQGAIIAYNMAINLNPYDNSMYIQLANLLNTERDFNSSIEVFFK